MSDALTDDEPAAPRRVSRRAVITAALGTGALVAAGFAIIPRILATDRLVLGKLVRPLLASKTFYVAHRGGSTDWPEMSLKGYVESVQHGADGLEISLARSMDGVWFGLHDETLDRTSGTADFVAADHTWAEISTHRISAAGTTNPNQPSQPYLRFDALIERYAATHTIFVDPKSVSPTHYPELIAVLNAAVPHPTETFIAKFYCTGTAWATIARAHRYKTWGFYYGSEIEADPTLLPRTEAYWDVLGMNYEGSEAAWRTILDYKKKVIGHVIPTKAAAKTALAKGASGLMVSGIVEVLG